MWKRKEKVAQRIKEEISRIIHDEIKDPRIGFLTVTRVELTNDLRFARIFFSIYGTCEQKNMAQKGLSSAKNYIRKLLGEKLKIKFTPEICFKLDENSEYSIHMDELFEKIKNEKER